MMFTCQYQIQELHSRHHWLVEEALPELIELEFRESF